MRSFAVVHLLSLLAPLTLSAAIVTERNDVGVTPPGYATFVGSAASPGIASHWIPYGTYTDGAGSTEYTRVTSNLVGVVASALGGYFERSLSTEHNYYTWPRALLRPMSVPAGYWSDDGEYLESVTNQSLRIADQLNRTVMHYYDWADYYGEGYTGCSYSDDGDALEAMLVRDDVNWYDEGADWWYPDLRCFYRSDHSGLLAQFGGRLLEEMVDVADPPVSTSWTDAIPHRLEDKNTWSRVAPVYTAVKCDDVFWPSHAGVVTNRHNHVFPAVDVYDRAALVDFIVGDHTVWGEDVHDAATNLVASVRRIPLDCTIEDVLGVDTGWVYPVTLTNDYWIVTGPYIGSVKCERYSGSWDSDEDAREWYGQSSAGETYMAWVSYLGNSSWNFVIYGGGTMETYVSVDATVSADGSLASATFDGYTATKVSLYDGEDVFAHWRNGSTRLDWQRLGLVCQLERQMETTWDSLRDISLPFSQVSGSHGLTWEGSVPFSLPLPSDGNVTNYVNLADATWGSSPSVELHVTNETALGWCYPTVRTDVPSIVGVVSGHGLPDAVISMSWEQLEDLVAECVATNGMPTGQYCMYYGTFSFSPHLGPPSVAVQLAGGEVTYYTNSHYEVSEPALDSSEVHVLADLSDMPTNGTVSVARSLSKTSLAYYTHARDEEYSAITGAYAQTYTAYPRQWAVGILASQTRYALDCAMVAAGEQADQYIGTSAESVPWQTYVDADAAVLRRFRASPLTAECATFDSILRNRRDMAASLDGELKALCVANGGLDCSVLSEFGKLTAGEVSELCDNLRGKLLPVTFAVHSPQEWTVVVTNGVTVSNEVDVGSSRFNCQFSIDSGRNVTVHQCYFFDLSGDHYHYYSGPVYVGSCGWESELAEDDANCADDYTDVRVDGHQIQLIRNLWRFRNLRDPDL